MTSLVAPRVFCIGTHHKTGTLWMRAVFRKLAAWMQVPERVVYPSVTGKVIPDDDRIFLFSWSSTFRPAILDLPEVRILHVIRDPRDVLLSGYRYHQHAPRKGEDFLHEPREDLDGLTYQQHLNALPTEAEKMLFEMREKHAQTLGEMLGWNYDRPNGIEVRYEDLIADTSCVAFREHLRNLGLTEAEVGKGVEIFWGNALFGGLARPEDRVERVARHVASGAARQWRDRMPRAIAEAYAEAHGADLVRLGYETHPTNWVEEVRHAA
ncbi:sulfotransferase domain-containing protein [Jannaschia sp. 2305UL9-9]|uniref:sulfotransferase domain-containing protein n=1 Tax=Jannaschia sp. 2305UL9-9 TaxID=3121638 RepID=UPI003528E31D